MGDRFHSGEGQGDSSMEVMGQETQAPAALPAGVGSGGVQAGAADPPYTHAGWRAMVRAEDGARGGFNIARMLVNRSQGTLKGCGGNAVCVLERWAEVKALVDTHPSYLPLPGAAKSTIAVSFSCDGQRLASTHGDHSVKIFHAHTGDLQRILMGHPRTPWTVQWHPSTPHLLASGCIGKQVRVWDVERGVCVCLCHLAHPIISLSFHPCPLTPILAVAAGRSLHLWPYHAQPQPYKEWEHSSILRCVRFHPCGRWLIMGAANPTPSRPPPPTPPRQAEQSFRLLLWSFSAPLSLLPPSLRPPPHPSSLSHPLTLVHRALIYNDGGLDLSPCGRYLCCTADLCPPSSSSSSSSSANMSAFLGQSSSGNLGLSFSSSGNLGLSSSSSSAHTGQSSSSANVIYIGPPSSSGILGQSSSSSAIIGQSSSSANLGQSSPPPPATAMPLPPAALPRPPSANLGPSSGNIGQSSSANIGSSNPATSTSTSTAALPRSLASVNLALFTPPPSSSSAHLGPPSGNVGNTPAGGLLCPVLVYVTLPLPPTTTSPSQEQPTPTLSPFAVSVCRLEGVLASAVTSVKLSPTGRFAVLGYGVRDNPNLLAVVGAQGVQQQADHTHAVAALYTIGPQSTHMTHVGTVWSREDDVNIARFHPTPGLGLVYGTKQGRVRVLSPIAALHTHNAPT